MRVLVVDQDSALLTAITQLLGDYFAIDAVTTKADCLDLVRVNEFEVIVAGERLEDGSGLELLGQMGRDRPDMLRIFAVDRERLKLLKGRLGPFRLFRTLSYPIEPRQLLAALSAAAGIEEEIEAPEETAVVEPVTAPAPPQPVEVTVRSVRQPVAPIQARVSTATQTMVEAPAPTARREVHDFTLVDEEEPAPPPQPKSHKRSKSRSSARVASLPPPSGGRGSRQPTPEALAVGSRLATASRAKARQTNGPALPPPLMESGSKRSAVIVGAGAIVAIGVMAVALHVFNTNDTPTFTTANLSAQATHDPPEVIKLVADTELAFQQDDYKAARTDVAALQQIAPTHPRLPFFEALLAKHESESATPLSGPARWFSRHTSPPPKVSSSPPLRTAASTSPARVQPPSVSTASLRARPGAQAPQMPETPSRSFSGKTVEASNAATLTKEAELIKRIPPEYPDDAVQKGIEGAVDLAFVVSRTGDVQDVTIVHSEPSSIFNRAAIAAVRRWKYQPRIVNGAPVEAHVQLRVAFKLEGR
jgi:TonB family protein